tara:strand:+ start:1229 stop:1423 length:195 start_codon:yes stop_codon:yes gene_type:complete
MEEKDKIMINWINGFNAGNKKEKYALNFRLGTFTVLEIKACMFCDENCTAKKFRIMIFNLGLEF